MFDTGCFMGLSLKKAVWGRLLYPFLLNVYMHDFDQFVENLNNEYFNITLLFTDKNYRGLTVKKWGGRRICKFSNQILKKYDELVKFNKRYGTTLNQCVFGRGRPFEDVWKFCCVK